jgi:phosphoglycolate phosphatase-like HAD superfamily hydrolase
VAPPTALAIDLDGVLGDTRRLWDDWLAGAGRVLGVDPASLPTDRGEAAALLDSRGGGNWRTLLGRFAEDRAPVYLRPSAEVSAALRRLAAAGTRVGVFTDAPQELTHIALAQLGAARRIEAVETGEGALERLLGAFGSGTVVVRTREELRLADQPSART